MMAKLLGLQCVSFNGHYSKGFRGRDQSNIDWNARDIGYFFENTLESSRQSSKIQSLLKLFLQILEGGLL